MTRYAHVLKREVPACAALIFVSIIAYDHSLFRSYPGCLGVFALGCILIASARFSGKETHLTQLTYIAGALAIVSSVLLLVFVLLDI